MRAGCYRAAMFTGIISDVGYVLHLEGGVENLRRTQYAYDAYPVYESASVSASAN